VGETSIDRKIIISGELEASVDAITPILWSSSNAKS